MISPKLQEAMADQLPKIIHEIAVYSGDECQRKSISFVYKRYNCSGNIVEANSFETAPEDVIYEIKKAMRVRWQVQYEDTDETIRMHRVNCSGDEFIVVSDLESSGFLRELMQRYFVLTPANH